MPDSLRTVTITGLEERWFEVSPRFFVSADGRSRIGFAEDRGRNFALTAGSWRVLERVH